jgi:hypothetical protein
MSLSAIWTLFFGLEPLSSDPAAVGLEEVTAHCGSKTRRGRQTTRSGRATEWMLSGRKVSVEEAHFFERRPPRFTGE